MNSRRSLSFVFFISISQLVWSFNLMEEAGKLREAIFPSAQSRNDINPEDAYAKSPEKLMNYSIAEGLGKNREKDYSAGLNLMMQAVNHSDSQAAKAHYFLGKQYVQMSGLTEYESDSESFVEKAKQSLRKAIDLESSNLSRFAENKQWAQAARKLFESIISKVVSLSALDFNILASLAVLESGENCPEERLDIVQSVFNRINSNQFPNDVQSVAFHDANGDGKRDQFEPFFKIGPSAVSSESSAAAYISKKRGMTYEEALAAIRGVKNDAANEQKMKSARKFVGGRNFFKGKREYDHRVVSEDPLRKHGCNFHHINPDTQTYQELKILEQKGPSKIIQK